MEGTRNGKNMTKNGPQECIPVGCVPSAAVAVSPGGGVCLLPGGVCSGEVSAPGVSASEGGVVSQHALRQTHPLWTHRRL